ncbi:MAG: MATE family efflux transporter [Bacteroidales bacterium]|nr:MATE family efflux transporter [Bacteroidales bacterium]MCI1786153.1 MATE family efflux transporter [Bacteroidales bacterium]
MKEEQNEKFIKMTTSDPGKLVCEFAVPSIISMLISNIYNMVDTLFVGRLDTQSTAALGIVFSYMALIQAVAFFFGHGSANYISRALGARNTKQAEFMAATGFYSALIFGIAFSVAGFVFMDPLLNFFGSTPTILPYARSYFIYILVGTPFIAGSFVLNNQMRLQGNAMSSMIGISIGAVLNIGLDPLFIFGFGMGIGGAGLATAISQIISFAIMFNMAGKRGGIEIRLRNFKPNVRQYREIFAGGSPSLARQSLASIASICLNQLAGGFGDAAVAAFSIVNRVMMFVSSVMLGFGQGFQPVCGFNYGAGLYDRVRKAFRFSAIIATAYCTIFAVAGIFFAPGIVAVFRAGDSEVIAIGAKLLKYQCFVYPLVGFVILTNMYLQNIKKTVSAITVAMSRQGIFFIPLLFIGAAHFGLDGIIAAQPLSDTLSFALSLPLCISALKGMKTKVPAGI